MNASFGVNRSWVVSALMACLEIMLWLVLHVKAIPGGFVLIMVAVSIGSVVLCVCTTFWITCSIRVIVGTAPGVLFCVCCRCVCRVILSLRFAVGFCDYMMGGASVILGIVMIGKSSITLCCRSISSILTLCSSLFVSTGFNILVMLAWRFSMHARPCGVADEILVSLASSSVNARRCCIFVRFGSWQCCGYTSVDPDILYVHVSGM